MARRAWRSFASAGYLPEALVNYLALLGWSPGENEEIVPAAEMARRFDLATVSHSAAVFDTGQARVDESALHEGGGRRRVWRALALPYLRARRLRHDADATCHAEFVESLLPMAVGSVDRLEEIPERVAFVFDWDAARGRGARRARSPTARARSTAFAEAVAGGGPLDREAFRAAAATRAREATGLKGRALFHPIRVALTAADSGPELDLAVPAIDRGAALPPGSGVAPIVSVRRARRARCVARADSST